MQCQSQHADVQPVSFSPWSVSYVSICEFSLNTKQVQPHLDGTWVSVPDLIAIHLTVVTKNLNSTSCRCQRKSQGITNHHDSSSGDHGHLYKMSWQSIQYLLRCFSLDQSGESINWRAHFTYAFLWMRVPPEIESFLTVNQFWDNVFFCFVLATCHSELTRDGYGTTVSTFDVVYPT